jgi:hypothetical protein
MSDEDDDVRGVAFPLLIGGGARKEVSKGLAVTASANVQLGVGAFNRGLGWEPSASFILQGGVEFDLF